MPSSASRTGAFLSSGAVRKWLSCSRWWDANLHSCILCLLSRKTRVNGGCTLERKENGVPTIQWAPERSFSKFSKPDEERDGEVNCLSELLIEDFHWLFDIDRVFAVCVHTDISKIVLYRRSGSQRKNHNDSGDDFSTRCSIVSFADIIPAKHQHLNVFESADERIYLRALRCTHRAASMTVNHLASLKLEGLHMHQCLLRGLFWYSCLDGPKSEFFRFKT